MNTEQYVILFGFGILTFLFGFILGKYTMVNYVIKTLSALLAATFGMPVDYTNEDKDNL